MNILGKKGVYKWLVLISCFSLSASVYSSEKTPFWGDFFDSPDKQSAQKTSSLPTTRLSSQSSSLSQPPQRVIHEPMNPVSQQVSVFLQGFPKILRDMAELERHIPTLIPGHRRNPENLRHCPKSADWRVLMAYSVEGALKKFKTIDEILEDLEKKKALKKEKAPKSKLQNPEVQKPTVSTEEVAHEAMAQLPEMLRVWLLSTCNPGSQTMRQFLLDYDFFPQWWDALPTQLMESTNILLIYSLLKQENNTSNNAPMLLSLLDDLLVQSILLKAQSLYEELLPTFMDLKTSNATLRSLREEASREDAQLKSILDNSDLYKQIECHIASAIKSAVEPLMEECLKQTTDEDLKTRVREAFQQAMADALTGKLDSPREKGEEKGPKESQNPSVEVDMSKILKKNLQKIIVNVIRETINAGLNKATGRVKKDEQPQKASYWRSSSNNTTDTSDYSDQQSLTVDIAPIMQTLSEFIKPSDQTASHSWSWFWSSANKNPIASHLIPINIPADIQRQWKIPSYGPVKKLKPSVRRFPKIADITPIRTGLLKEIRNYRQYSYSSQPQGLPDFIKQKKSVHLLFDFPRAYSYVPGIQGAQLLPKILRFFEEYEGLITRYHGNLKKTDMSDLGLYLDSTRAGTAFCKNNKAALFTVFPLLDPTELMHDWVSIEVFSLFDRKFLEDENKDSFLAELEENVFLLAMVDGFADESLKAGTLDITRLIGNAKKILFFKEKCQAIKEGKSLPSQEQALPDQLFQEKCNATEGVSGTIGRMVNRQKSRKVEENEMFIQDRDLLIPFFTELFRKTLTECLFGFGLTPEKLETLKRLSSPLQPTQPFAGPTEDSNVILHVPVRLRKDSDRSSKKSISSSGSAQKQSDDESGLPPIQKLNLEGISDLF